MGATFEDKTAPQIVNAFDKILSGGRIPKRLCTDAAKDFTSDKFQKFVKGKTYCTFLLHIMKASKLC